MKSYYANLQESLSSGVYDKTKTSLFGRMKARTVSGEPVLSARLAQFLDYFTPNALGMSLICFRKDTNRLFLMQTTTSSGTIRISLYNFDKETGDYTFVGYVTLTVGNIAATSHTPRGFKVDDTGSTWKIFVSTSGSVAINGGLYVGWLTAGINDFNGQTLPSATGAGQKAVYFFQPKDELGVRNTALNAANQWGIALPLTSSNPNINTKIYTISGTLLANKHYAWETNGVPDVDDQVINGINAQTTAFGGTSPSAYFRLGASQLNYSVTAGEPIILMNGTGNVPSNFTASTVTTQTIYFMRDLQLSGGIYYFNLSTTTGGAAVVPATTTSSFTMMRAFGTSTNLFYGQTGTPSPAIPGTLIQTNSLGYCIPTNVPASPALNGSDCLYFPSSANVNLGKISEIFTELIGTLNGTNIVTGLSSTAGLVMGQRVVGNGIPYNTIISSILSLSSIQLSNAATISGSATLVFGMQNWSSFNSVTIAGTGIDVTTMATTQANYSNELDQWVFLTNVSMGVVKPHQNAGTLTTIFGGLTNEWFENKSLYHVPIAPVTVGGAEESDGWLFISGATAGQRGVFIFDLRSDKTFGHSYLISKILTMPSRGTLKAIHTVNILSDYTHPSDFYVRSANTISDSIFDTASGGWTKVSPSSDLSSIVLGRYFQIKILPVMIPVCRGAEQVKDLIYDVDFIESSSDYWFGANQNTTQDGISPMYVSFMLSEAYSPLPTKFVVRGIDTDGNTVATFDTSINGANFTQSNNNGTTWSAWTNMAGFYNTAKTTELRVQVSTPPVTADNKIIWSIRES
jgi:hypothetical protein